MRHLPLVAMDHAQRIGRDDGHLVIGQVDDLVRCGPTSGEASLATKCSPSPTPTTSGLPSRAAMITSG